METIETARRAENQELALLLERIAGLLEAQGAGPFRGERLPPGRRDGAGMPERLGRCLRAGGCSRSRTAARHRPEHRVPDPGVRPQRPDQPARAPRGGGLGRRGPGHGAGAGPNSRPSGSRRPRNRDPRRARVRLPRRHPCGCSRLRRAADRGHRCVHRHGAPGRGGPSERVDLDCIGVGDRTEPPVVATLLAVDEEYRQGARDGSLARIAPRRFNPEGEAWLPILHTERDGWSLTALFSNSARAHQLGRTHDWVVIYADRDGRHDQCTVVTERRGYELPRVIRGREFECSTLAERTRTQPGASSAPPGEAGGHPE